MQKSIDIELSVFSRKSLKGGDNRGDYTRVITAYKDVYRLLYSLDLKIVESGISFDGFEIVYKIDALDEILIEKMVKDRLKCLRNDYIVRVKNERNISMAN